MLHQLAAVIVSALVAAHPAPRADTISAKVAGTVVDTSGRPLAFAEVAVIGAGKRSFTDVEGRFHLAGLPRVAVFSVRRVGYEPLYFELALDPKEDEGLRITMTPAVATLDTVTIVAKGFKPPRLNYTKKFDPFYERLHAGFGNFFDRDDIRKKAPKDLYDLLRNVPGVHVRQIGMEKTLMMNSSCTTPKVFLDGMALKYGWEVLGSIDPADIEGIEIYKTVASLPADALGECGAIKIWMRTQ
ncbi:MAG: TonB-dependent receptor plug [Gemmatimonadetes bacterium]|nr:TonB-dependent receptor plug [Gemmatimonadota bacterium]